LVLLLEQESERRWATLAQVSPSELLSVQRSGHLDKRRGAGLIADEVVRLLTVPKLTLAENDLVFLLLNPKRPDTRALLSKAF
jgi:hypothetical protein